MTRGSSHRAPLLWLAVPLMLGTAAGRLSFPAPPAMLFIGALLAGMAALLPWSAAPVRWAAMVGGAMLLAGTGNYRWHNPPRGDWETLPPREAQLLIHLERVFPRTDLSSVGLGTITDGEGRVRELVGHRVYFSIQRSPADPTLVRSATVRATGVLAVVPRAAAAGTFERYLDDAGVHFRIGRGRLDAVETAPAGYYVFLEHAALQLNAWLDAGIRGKRPALAAVFRAMMLGQKHELSAEQDTLFMHSGTMHLFAINGLHIGVVAVSLHALLALLRCPRALAAVVTLAALWFDVDTTGASPSAVRAFLLVACYETGFVLRRPANGIATLAGAALITLLLDPNALFSASFQMSYGVVLAILCFGLPLAEALQQRLQPFRNLPPVSWTWRHRCWVWLLRHFWPAFGIGTAATLVGTITGPAFFGVIAPVGFVSNLVLVPLASLVIVAGFASIVAGAIGLLPIGILFNHAALLVLVVIDALIRRSVTLPSAWWVAQWRGDGWPTVALAVLLATVVAGYGAKWRGSLGGWWPPFVVTAVALALGVRLG